MKKLLFLLCAICAFGLAAVSCSQNETETIYSVVADDQMFEGFTVFYPEDLSAFPKKDKLPVLVMSGPGCVKSAAAFQPFFEEMAAHGYLMIACGPLSMNVPGERPAGMPRMVQNTKEDMLSLRSFSAKAQSIAASMSSLVFWTMRGMPAGRSPGTFMDSGPQAIIR